MRPTDLPTPRQLGAIDVYSTRISSGKRGTFEARFSNLDRANRGIAILTELGFYANQPVKSAKTGKWIVSFALIPHESNPKRRRLLSREPLLIEHTTDTGVFNAYFKSYKDATKFVERVETVGGKLMRASFVPKDNDYGAEIRVKFSLPSNKAKRKSRIVSNPKTDRPVLIYSEVEKVFARKAQNHVCDDECAAADHKYYHTFDSKPNMFGLPNGDLLIKG